MGLDVNGYNAQFRQFVDFAAQEMKAGRTKAIALTDSATLFSGSTITVQSNDKVGAFFRKGTVKNANNEARTLFRNAIIDMYGGESKIPESVKTAMLLKDYGHGKPLTARRIMAVKAAIDAEGSASKAGATERQRLESFSTPELRKSAIELGFSKGEMAKVACAAKFLAQAKGMDEATALKELATPNSNANRVMNYGGRFMASADSFANGLRLMDSFKSWFSDLKDTMLPVLSSFTLKKNVPPEAMAPANTVSKLNVALATINTDTLKAMEKFAFEELAVNNGINLSEPDPEKTFGFANNPASRFFGMNFGDSCTATINQIPPAKRAVVYAAFEKFTNVATNAEEATKPAKERFLLSGNRTMMLGRILKNLDKLESLMQLDRLSAKSIIDTCFPDMQDKGNYDLKAVAKFLDNITTEINKDEDDGGIYTDIPGAAAQMLMERTGCTFDEMLAVYREGKPPPPNAPYISEGTMQLEAFDGTPDAMCKQMVGDLDRPSNYSIKGGQSDILKADENAGFGFNFPGMDRIVTNGHAHGKANINTVVSEVKKLCGTAHPSQTASVFMMLSQAGTMGLIGGLSQYGIRSNEHSAVDFTLSKDESTGSIKIKYSSPAELPFEFSWTATIDVNGTVTTTPIKFDKHIDSLDAKTARSYVIDNAAANGIELDSAQIEKATELTVKYATDMKLSNAKLFAGFAAATASMEHKLLTDMDTLAADTAKSLREWRSFEFGDEKMTQVASTFKDYANDTIADYLSESKADKFHDNIHDTMIADSNRATFILDGKTFEKTPARELVQAFKQLVPDTTKQKALSSLMNQLCFQPQTMISMNSPLESGVEAHKLPGAEGMVQRNMYSGLYMSTPLNTAGHGITHNLVISPDGRTATLTQTISAELNGPHSDMLHLVSFGTMTFSQTFQIDLTKDIPVVTDCKISQTID